MREGSGAFFAIDAVAWRRALTLGLNPACAYLTLAAGTGRGQRRTTWSVHAVENYAGIGRQRAAAAIRDLIGADLARIVRGGVRPIYDLGLPIVDDDEPPGLIWLPQSLVACEPGMAPRTSPLSMLRATGRADLLGLLIDLYGQHDLPGEWGIDRRVLQWRHEGRRLHEGKTWTIWGFTPIGLFASESWPPAREFVGDITGHDDRVRREGEFWNALQTIVRFGLAEWVPALCEAAPGGEVIHSLTHAGGLSLERDAFAVARAAALSLLPAPLAREAALSVDILIPVPSAFGDVKMAGIFRLTRLPDTTATRAWLAKMENLRENLGVYEAIVASNQRPPRPQAIGRA